MQWLELCSRISPPTMLTKTNSPGSNTEKTSPSRFHQKQHIYFFFLIVLCLALVKRPTLRGSDNPVQKIKSTTISNNTTNSTYDLVWLLLRMVLHPKQQTHQQVLPYFSQRVTVFKEAPDQILRPNSSIYYLPVLNSRPINKANLYIAMLALGISAIISANRKFHSCGSVILIEDMHL